MSSNSNTILALDVGDARIGVARANSIARIATPLTTLHAQDDVIESVCNLIKQHDANTLVVGLPRNMAGEETAQTVKIKAFVDSLRPSVSIPIVFQDESLTSVKAEEALGNHKKGYNKEDVDAMAATFILNDYLLTSGN